MTRAQKTILGVVFVTLSLWRIFEIPAVANAFWAFCTVGALPWTDRTVAPNTVLKLLIMAFPLCLLLIFRTEFLAAVPHRPQPKPSKPKSPVVVVLPVKARAPFKVRLGKIDRVVGAVMDAEARFIRKAVAKLARFGRIAASDLWQAIILSGHIIAKTVVLCGRILLRAWGWAEPSIRKFDHWLDVTLHKSRFISFFLDTGSDVGRLAGNGLQRASAYTQRRTARK